MKPRVLVLESIHGAGLDRLRAAGFDVDVSLGLDAGEIVSRLAGVKAVIVKSVVRVDARLLSGADALRVIGRAGAGLDNIDVEAAAARDIVVHNVPGGNAAAAADFTVMQMLCLARNAYRARDMMAAGDFRRDLLMGRDLGALTVGIVGLGHVGRLVATRLRAFGCRIIGLDPAVTAEAGNALGIERIDSLAQLLPQVDILSLHVPLTPATRGMIGAAELAAMKSGAFVLNIARGAVLDEAALAAAIRAGRLGGAAIDVFEREPPYDAMPGQHDYVNPLLSQAGIFATPHMAASTEDAQRHIASVLADKMIQSLREGAK